MSGYTALNALTAQMTREGIRRLLVLSGEASWCHEQVQHLRDTLPGDWLWVSPDAAAEPSCTPLALQTLLDVNSTMPFSMLWPGLMRRLLLP